MTVLLRLPVILVLKSNFPGEEVKCLSSFLLCGLNLSISRSKKSAI